MCAVDKDEDARAEAEIAAEMAVNSSVLAALGELDGVQVRFLPDGLEEEDPETTRRRRRLLRPW